MPKLREMEIALITLEWMITGLNVGPEEFSLYDSEYGGNYESINSNAAHQCAVSFLSPVTRHNFLSL